MALGNDVTLKVGFDIDKFQAELRKTNGILTNWGNSVNSVLKTALAGFAFVDIGRQMIEVTAQFQKFEAILTNTLGSNSKAQQALKDIKKFAINTPFEVDEITAAYVRWANMGLTPTIDRMKKIGDVASSLGAGFEQTAEAFKDLMVGQTKRIEEVGISATQANGKIQLSFKGVNIEIDKTAEGVQKALDVYSQLNGVLGTSDAIAKTLGGQISNLSDAWTAFLDSLGTKSSGPLSYAVKTLTNLLNGLSKPIYTQPPQMSVWDKAMQALGIHTDGAAKAMAGLGRGAESTWELSDEFVKKSEEEAQRLAKQKAAAEAAAKAYNELFHSKAKAATAIPEGSTALGNANLGGVSMPDKVGAPFTVDAKQLKLQEKAQKYQEYADQITELNAQIRDSFIDLGINVLEIVGTKLGDANMNIGAGLRMALGKFMSMIGGMFIKFALASKAFQSLLKNIMNPIGPGLLLAAGAALAVAGSAISAAASRGPGGGGGGIGGGGSSEYVGRNSVNANTQSERRLVIVMKAEGQDLVATYDSAKSSQQIRRGRRG